MTSLIRPFKGLRPVPERAVDVAAPPYDVLNTAEARERADSRPLSFLHISKPEIDLPDGTDPFAPEVYAKGAENLQRMIYESVLVRDTAASFYVYRLRMDGHEQEGLVFAASVAEYDNNRIRRHELTQPYKEDDRVRQITALNAQTGPVLLAYRSSAEVKAIIDAVVQEDPVYDLVTEDGIGHSLWVIDNFAQIEQLTRSFEEMDALYIADGHHRSAAASRVAAAKKKANPAHTGSEAYNYFLCVAFPHDETRILDYNRVIRDLNDWRPEQLLEQIEQRFEVMPSDVPVRPDRPAQFGMYLENHWYRLDIREEWIPVDDPVARLDVNLLQDNLIGPLLGIEDQSTDSRIEFVGGVRGLEQLEKSVDSGDMRIAFSFFPTRMQDLMAVADANEVMPTKSTWFEPKLADGLVTHVLD
jgi:uncharacterized protein (DUF1015 family)